MIRKITMHNETECECGKIVYIGEIKSCCYQRLRKRRRRKQAKKSQRRSQPQ